MCPVVHHTVSFILCFMHGIICIASIVFKCILCPICRVSYNVLHNAFIQHFMHGIICTVCTKSINVLFTVLLEPYSISCVVFLLVLSVKLRALVVHSTGLIYRHFLTTRVPAELFAANYMYTVNLELENAK
jgi:hypothetical protein